MAKEKINRYLQALLDLRERGKPGCCTALQRSAEMLRKNEDELIEEMLDHLTIYPAFLSGWAKSCDALRNNHNPELWDAIQFLP